ncbi:hypothetical protein [uncultured Roseibium sp.]|uniref:hypothetical protein n=1 Tax=uncultured Roseibium sp. TaxID=1936171 RepID=UPI00262BA6A5|nr:hypothetical protein [uncultured Roseibium sp.]
MIRLLSTLVAASFCSSALAQPEDPRDEKIKELEKRVEALEQRPEAVPGSGHHSAMVQFEQDIRVVCGDAPAALWSAKNGEGEIRFANILTSTIDPGQGSRGTYRVCNWSATEHAVIVQDPGNSKLEFDLRIRSCVDVANTIHILARARATDQVNGKERTAYGFYCRID